MEKGRGKGKMELLNTFITRKLSVFWFCNATWPPPLKLINLCISIISGSVSTRSHWKASVARARAHVQCVCDVVAVIVAVVVILPIHLKSISMNFSNSQFKAQIEIHTHADTY